VLELHDAEGAFERIEPWLREQGFLAPDGGIVWDSDPAEQVAESPAPLLGAIGASLDAAGHERRPSTDGGT
jgi:hypothetical protein